MSDEIPIEDVEILARSLHESCRKASKINMYKSLKPVKKDNEKCTCVYCTQAKNAGRDTLYASILALLIMGGIYVAVGCFFS